MAVKGSTGGPAAPPTGQAHGAHEHYAFKPSTAPLAIRSKSQRAACSWGGSQKVFDCEPADPHSKDSPHVAQQNAKVDVLKQLPREGPNRIAPEQGPE
ncbi:hypothetical protein FRC01_006068 [Tulasnella sp. 417]|nr:hypothetical protein FRC01_006068 [Tulasnella sp. 417]